MPRVIQRLRRLSSAIVSLALAAGSAAPVAAWNNGGDDPGYGTHDWVIDAALNVLAGRADGWFDVAVARAHSDDPDNVAETGENDHVYRDTGIRGGAIHRIGEHYAAAVKHHAAGNFAAASREIGLVAHYYSDIMMPWHSHYDGIGAAGHLEYEQKVGLEMRSASDAPEWQSTRRTVSTISNARTTAINAAAYSRSKFPALYDAFMPAETLSSEARSITRLLMVRTANDLADMIWSIGQHRGVPPRVATLDVSVKWPYAKQNEPFQGVYVTARDAAGRPIEGLRVEITLPIPYGSTTKTIVWTDQDGWAKWAGAIGSSPYMAKRTVSARSTTNGTTVTGSTSFATSPPWGSFTASINDARPVAGETVTVTSVATDSSGKPIKGLMVDWTWDYGSAKVRTTALTDSRGVARSSRVVTTSTTFNIVNVTAHAISASSNRSRVVSFQRQPGGQTEPYKGWFIDVWDSKFRDDIVWLAESKITAGCGEEIFCPDGAVTRSQMASFLVRALDLPSTSRDYFADDDGNKHEVNINRLAASGITAGCGGDRFCPNGIVTRSQMASFLVRALGLPATGTDYFADDDGNKHEDRINRLAASKITSGCGEDRFCPNGTVTRGQMAAFLRRGLTR